MLDILVANDRKFSFYHQMIYRILLLLQHVCCFLLRASEHRSVALELIKFLIFSFCLKLLKFKISVFTEGKA